MSNLDDLPDGRGKRGRFEIRFVFVLVLAVLAVAAAYAVFVGEPNRQNRVRDDLDTPVNLGTPVTPPAAPAGRP